MEVSTTRKTTGVKKKKAKVQKLQKNYKQKGKSEIKKGHIQKHRQDFGQSWTLVHCATLPQADLSFSVKKNYTYLKVKLQNSEIPIFKLCKVCDIKMISDKW